MRNILLRIFAGLVLVGAVLAWNASEARAQSLFGDVSGDGKVTVLDVSMARLIALGVLSPTGAQLDSANVFPLLSTTGCGPSSDAICIDFASRLGPNSTPDRTDITVGDVSVIRLIALKVLKTLPRLTILSAAPDPVLLTSSSPLAIQGNGFPLENFTLTFRFTEPAVPVNVDCVVGTAPSFPVTCGPAGYTIQAVSATQIDVTTPVATLVCGAPATCDTNANSTTQAVLSVTDDTTATTATAPAPVNFADAQFKVKIVSGDNQSGFPVIQLGQPLVVQALDLNDAPLATLGTYCQGQNKACYIEFHVVLASPDNLPYSDHLADLNGQSDVTSVDLDSGGFAQTTVLPYPNSSALAGTIYIEARLKNLYGEDETGVIPARFTVNVAATDGTEVVLTATGGDGQTCAAGEICPYTGAAAVPLSFKLIDKFGAHYTAEPATYTISEDTLLRTPADLGALDVPLASAVNCASLAGSTPSWTCNTNTYPASVQVKAGNFGAASLTGKHTVKVSVTGGVTLKTVKPSGGITYVLNIQKPVASSIELLNPATQAERVADRVTATGPFDNNVLVRDQFGRPFDGAGVTYSFVAPSGDNSAMVSPQTTAGGGFANSQLTIGNTGNSGDITVTASIAAAAPISQGDSAEFLYAVGTSQLPPVPVNLSLVEVTRPVSNNAPTGYDFAGTGSGNGNVNQLLVRGSLGAVRRQGTDDITLYSVQLAITLAGVPQGTQCAAVSNGLPADIGCGVAPCSDGTDLDRARFQFALPAPAAGALGQLRVFNGAACAGDASLPRYVVFQGTADEGFVANRTRSEIAVFKPMGASYPPVIAPQDADTLAGPQALHLTGRGPTGIAYFNTEDPLAATMNRALVVNYLTHDVSLVRVEEEVMAQGGDLTIVGASPSTQVTLLSSSSNFLLGGGSGTASRNADCNVGLDSANFATSIADDCAVAPGDKILIHPAGSTELGGSVVTVTRTIVRVVDAVTLELSAPVTSTQVFLNSDFRIVSNYREVDADNNTGTTSTGADPGISRVPIPQPDPNVIDNDDTLSTVRVAPRASDIAVWRPSSPIDGATNLQARAYIAEKLYLGLYVLNMVRDPGTGQWTFTFANTGVDSDSNAVDDKFFPLVSLRPLTRPAAYPGCSTEVIAGTTQCAQISDGPDQVVVDKDRELAFVVVDSQAKGSTSPGTVSVIALKPDPVPTVYADRYFDPLIRFPGQIVSADPPAFPGSPGPTVNCGGGTSAVSAGRIRLPSFVGCEVDLDLDPATAFRASSATDGNVYFDCNADGSADDIDTDPPGTPTVYNAFKDRAGASTGEGGVSPLTPRTTGLAGDWWSQEIDSFFPPVRAGTGACAGPADPDTLWGIHAGTATSTTRLQALVKDFNPYRFLLPRPPGSVADVRADVALLSVRGQCAEDGTGVTAASCPVSLSGSSGNANNEEWQPIYQVDIGPGDSTNLKPVLSNSGAGGVTLSVPNTTVPASYPLACALDLPRLKQINYGSVGTAQGGGANTITLEVLTASAVDDFYTGGIVTITGGTGVGQTRLITGYTGLTREAVVSSNWATPPDGTSTYAAAAANPRMADNYTANPRAADLQITVNGAPNLLGIDLTADTPDDVVRPGDILITDQGPQPGFVYRYVITGLDSLSPSTVFRIRTDRCDDVCATGGCTLTRYRIQRTIKLIDFAATATSQEGGTPFPPALQDPSKRDAPYGIPFVPSGSSATATNVVTLSPVRALRDGGVNNANGMQKDFKDAGLLWDSATSQLKLAVTFSQGSASDTTGKTSVATADYSACLSNTNTAVRYGLDVGGCAITATRSQSNDASVNPVLHVEKSVNQAGGHILGVTDGFGYVLSPQTGDILSFQPNQSGATAISLQMFPPTDLLGGPTFTGSDTFGYPQGAVAPFKTRQDAFTAAPVQRVLVLNTQHDLGVVIEEQAGPLAVPHLKDTDNIAGFTGISFPMSFVSATGAANTVLDALAAGDFNSGFFGNQIGFVTSENLTPGNFLGVVDYSSRAPVDLDAAQSLLQGIAVGASVPSIADSAVDLGRGQIFVLVNDGGVRTIRAYDMATFAEVDLTTEAQGGGNACDSAVHLRLPAAFNVAGTDADAHALAVRDGVLLIGYRDDCSSGCGAGGLISLDTDNLVAANFTGTSCQVNPAAASVNVTLAVSSPKTVGKIAIQGDVAYFAGSSNGTSFQLGMLDLAPLWNNRDCGTSACLPRDAALAPLSLAPVPLLGGPIDLEINGNLLFVSENGTASGNSVEVFDVTPYTAAPSGTTAISYRAPQRIAKVSGAAVGACVGRMALNGDVLYAVDGRSFDWGGASQPACDRAGDNLTLVDLATPAFSSGTPPTLPSQRSALGDPSDDVRDVIFLATPPQ